MSRSVNTTHMKLLKQILALLLVIAIFVGINGAAYLFMTQKLSANYGEITQIKMIDLAKYLPFEETSELARVDSSFKLNDGDDLPVLDGAAALYPIFSAVVGATYPEESVSFDGENFTADSALHYTNTRGAYKAIVDGDADLIFCVKPSDEQLAYAAEKGVELEFVTIGYEAFVFIVNKDNPVDSLTTDQLRGMFAGEYTNWKEVGGDNYIIDVLQRNPGSGSQTALEAFMDGRELKKYPLGFLGRSIGFSFRFYVSDIVENGGVKMLSLDGVYPSKENVANGTYPIVSDLYVVYRKDDDNPNLRTLIDWILSPEGQKIVEDSGYIPINLKRG